ncbi:hypothetical protein L21SP5_00199 [Salinivirga cyanobacteriivorans]|uniref:Uncharacterized protein n=1 Tax=Salinivirga cyanobacteriivorans TaxID=1307839 RepID=A0A0S2HV17_9BACT|nr:hypothetical protein [Salinivirga cyanobacteriivorans]ALO13879.1 hypothetical protein L21SP5_00199 [Salinivirga cyanobacteriivorans]
MNKILIVFIIVLGSFNFLFSQNSFVKGLSRECFQLGLFEKGSDEIKYSIKQNIGNLNLFEYSHSIPELIDLLKSKNIHKQDWINYIDSLSFVLEKYNLDTSKTHVWGSDFKGIISLQAEFFIKSLKNYNNQSSTKDFLITETSKLLNRGYTLDELSLLLKNNEIKGQNNFWFFIQVSGSSYIEYLLKNRVDTDIELISTYMSNMEIVSTFKVPYYLQKRKWECLQKRINNPDLSALMNKRRIRIEDKNKSFFKEREGYEWDKINDF